MASLMDLLTDNELYFQLEDLAYRLKDGEPVGMPNLFGDAPQFAGLLGDAINQDQARRSGMLNVAANLLAAGQASTTPISTGAALAQGLSAGQDAYNQAFQNQLKNYQTAETLKKYQQDKLTNQMLAGLPIVETQYPMEQFTTPESTQLEADIAQLEAEVRNPNSQFNRVLLRDKITEMRERLGEIRSGQIGEADILSKITERERPSETELQTQATASLQPAFQKLITGVGDVTADDPILQLQNQLYYLDELNPADFGVDTNDPITLTTFADKVNTLKNEKQTILTQLEKEQRERGATIEKENRERETAIAKEQRASERKAREAVDIFWDEKNNKAVGVNSQGQIIEVDGNWTKDMVETYKKSKDSTTNVNVSVDTLTKGTQKNLETKTINLLDMRPKLQRIKDGFNRNFLTAKGRLGAKWAKTKDYLDIELSADEEAFLRKRTDFLTGALENLNQYIRDITGAAMSLGEADRIRAAIPDPQKMSPIEFEAALDRQMEQVEFSLARHHYMLNSGLSVKSIAEGDPKISLSDMPSLIRKETLRIVKQDFGKEKVSDLTKDEKMKLRLRVSKMFGLIE